MQRANTGYTLEAFPEDDDGKITINVIVDEKPCAKFEVPKGTDDYNLEMIARGLPEVIEKVRGHSIKEIYVISDISVSIVLR